MHHFGSRSFAAGKVDYVAELDAKFAIFKRKWNLPADLRQGAPVPLENLVGDGFSPGLHVEPLAAGPRLEPLCTTPDWELDRRVAHGRGPLRSRPPGRRRARPALGARRPSGRSARHQRSGGREVAAGRGRARAAIARGRAGAAPGPRRTRGTTSRRSASERSARGSRRDNRARRVRRRRRPAGAAGALRSASPRRRSARRGRADLAADRCAAWPARARRRRRVRSPRPGRRRADRDRGDRAPRTSPPAAAAADPVQEIDGVLQHQQRAPSRGSASTRPGSREDSACGRAARSAGRRPRSYWWIDRQDGRGIAAQRSRGTAATARRPSGWRRRWPCRPAVPAGSPADDGAREPRRVGLDGLREVGMLGVGQARDLRVRGDQFAAPRTAGGTTRARPRADPARGSAARKASSRA